MTPKRPRNVPGPVRKPASLEATVKRRILGSHFKEDGTPKRGYTTEAKAKAEATRFGKTYYRCDFCDRFHLASRP